MSSTAIYTSLEDLEAWFMESKDHVVWTCYHGFRGNRTRDYSAINEDDSLSVEESWENLKDHLSRQKGGKFHILKKTNGNHGLHAYYQATATANSAAIGATGQHAIYGQSPMTYINEQIEQRMEIYDLKQTIAGLQGALDEKKGFWDKITDAVVENEKFDPNAAIGAIAGIINRALGPRPTAVVHGSPAAATPPPPADDQEGEAYDNEKLIEAFTMLETVLPEGVDLETVLLDLGAYAQKNPEMFTSIYQSQIQGSYERTS